MRLEAPARTRSSVRARSSIICALVALTLTCGLPAADADASARTDRVERSVVKRLNGIRARNGLGKLRLDRKLARAADVHSSDMVRADFFAHESSDGTPFQQRIAAFVRRRETGETLAYLAASQHRKAARVVRLWMRSPGHRAALMTPRFRRIGVAKRRGELYGQPSAVFTADLATRR